MNALFLWKKNSIKELTKSLKKNGGRNRFGQISVFHRGGGAKQKFKFINYKSLKNFSGDNLNFILGIVRRFEYDSNRRCYLALICSEYSELGYILAQDKMFIGQVIGFHQDFLPIPEIGNVTKLKHFNLGHFVSNISLLPHGSSIFSRAAGAKSLLVKKYVKTTVLKLQSEQLKIFNSNCFATLGGISNIENKLFKYTKAGQTR